MDIEHDDQSGRTDEQDDEANAAVCFCCTCGVSWCT